MTSDHLRGSRELWGEKGPKEFVFLRVHDHNDQKALNRKEVGTQRLNGLESTEVSFFMFDSAAMSAENKKTSP